MVVFPVSALSPARSYTDGIVQLDGGGGSSTKRRSWELLCKARIWRSYGGKVLPRLWIFGSRGFCSFVGVYSSAIPRSRGMIQRRAREFSWCPGQHLFSNQHRKQFIWSFISVLFLGPCVQLGCRVSLHYNNHPGLPAEAQSAGAQLRYSCLFVRASTFGSSFERLIVGVSQPCVMLLDVPLLLRAFSFSTWMKKLSTMRSEQRRTGGGPPVPSNIIEMEERVSHSWGASADPEMMPPQSAVRPQARPQRPEGTGTRPDSPDDPTSGAEELRFSPVNPLFFTDEGVDFEEPASPRS
uniref:uncharacterized protein n=1 Tax=Pristiophorus japonicus TaxID=55135 RepID=UPI00398EA383